MTTNHSPKKGVVECCTCTWNGKKVRPLFFKIVSGPGVHRIRLPPVFTRRHGHNLADLVSLEVPNGLVWKVELFRSNGEAWFQGGWQEFQEHYSLQFGHLLLFTYIVGTCRFEVNIFDTTATEIDYSRYTGKNQTQGVESESDDSVVFLKEILAGKTVGRKNHDHDSNPPPKRDKKINRKQRSDQKPRRSSRVKKESRIFLDSSPSHPGDHIGDSYLTVQHKSSEGNIQPRDDNNGFKAYKRASGRNPFSIVVMLSSCHKWPLPITAGFAKVILENGKNRSSIVLVCEGKTWAVRCIRGSQRASFTCGWREFADDNHLKRGDTCVFEACEGNNLEWDVTIFRG